MGCGCKCVAVNLRGESSLIEPYNTDGCRFPAVVADLERVRASLNDYIGIRDRLFNEWAALKTENDKLAIARDKEFWREYADETVKELNRSNAELASKLAGAEHAVKDALAVADKLEQERDALAGELAALKDGLKKIAKWPDPGPNAGQGGPGPLYGAGMYAQYDIDRERHEKQIAELQSALLQETQ